MKMAMIRIMMKKWEKKPFPRISSRRNKERMREIPQTDQDPQHRGQRSYAEDIQEADNCGQIFSITQGCVCYCQRNYFTRNNLQTIEKSEYKHLDNKHVYSKCTRIIKKRS